MAYSQSFFGLRKGSTKSFTFQVLGGKQITKERVFDVRNPRTKAQMMQRSLFTNAVKFYSRGISAMFKFAYEDKKVYESDYNAFMRHNVANSVRISKKASADPGYPAIGNWLLSVGSLTNPSYRDYGENKWALELPLVSSAMTKVSDIASALKAAYNLQEGDIVTMVHILASGVTTENTPSVEPIGYITPTWAIKQFEVSESNEAFLVDLGLSTANGLLVYDATNESTDSYAQGFAFVFSRKAPNGLKVSTSQIQNNACATAIVEACANSAYIERVLASWNTADEAILEGSLLEKSLEPSPVEQGIKDTTIEFPASISDLNGKTITLNASATMNDLAEHLNFVVGSAQPLRVVDGFIANGSDRFHRLTINGNVVSIGAYSGGGPQIQSIEWI